MSAATDGARGFWTGRQVFVTGATGLLGSWLVETLLAEGAHVTCLLRDWVPESRLQTAGHLARVNIVHGDLESLDVVLRALNEYEIDSVFHLGAQTIVGTAARSPLSTFESNIKGTWTLLEACRLNPRLIERIVVASSDKAYGAHDHLPYTEATPLLGRFPYDVSKSCADLLGQAYGITYRLPIVITRCGNLYGGGDLNFNRLIPGTIRSVLEGTAPIIRSDGTFVRDYFYVRDAVAAYLAVAERLPDGLTPGEAFNFGTETPATVLEVVEAILGLMDSDLQPTILNQATHEIPRQYLDCTHARTALDWTATYPLPRGLEETIAWYRDWPGRRAPASTGAR